MNEILKRLEFKQIPLHSGHVSLDKQSFHKNIRSAKRISLHAEAIIKVRHTP